MQWLRYKRHSVDLINSVTRALECSVAYRVGARGAGGYAPMLYQKKMFTAVECTRARASSTDE